MYLTREKKAEIFSKYGKNEKDSGSPEAQIALFTYRITELTEHLKVHKKDFSTQRALLILVGKRRKLLDYLKRHKLDTYRQLIQELNLRK
ncbi:MAG TPA: 30S ribosomal protein S15 [Salinivirgaceae bacterium]|nr:30S ribosomal protein S15 [Salinivirgaceae bacterium]